jgi:hypothetical protein
MKARHISLPQAFDDMPNIQSQMPMPHYKDMGERPYPPIIYQPIISTAYDRQNGI